MCVCVCVCVQHLSSSAVAYLNVDVGVAGTELSVHASGLMGPLMRGAISSLTDPQSGLPLSQRWDGTIGDLGSGSDYTVFLDRLGIPSVDLSFRKKEAKTLYGVYHSVYDSFSYVEQQVDPTFVYHALQARPGGPTHYFTTVHRTFIVITVACVETTDIFRVTRATGTVVGPHSSAVGNRTCSAGIHT